MEHPKGAHYSGILQPYPQTVDLGWKGLPETNTLAYYEHSLMTEFFYDIGPGPCGHP
jgi:hypothetical protein